METIFEPTTTLYRHQGLIQAEIDGETVMMDADSGDYYGLDSVASRIWQLLETPITTAELIEQILQEYEVTPEQCQQDVNEFLTQLHKNKMIKISV
jgi:hypothetical protein